MLNQTLQQLLNLPVCCERCLWIALWPLLRHLNKIITLKKEVLYKFFRKVFTPILI